MATIQGVGPDDRSVPLKCDRHGRLKVILSGPLLWISMTLNAMSLAAILYLASQLWG